MRSFLFLLALCLAAFVTAQRCPITSQDVTGLNLAPIQPACAGLTNPPSADGCDTCGAALFRAFAPVLPKFNLTCENFPSDPAAANSAITSAITPCINVVLPALQGAGVQVGSLVALRSCPQTAGPKLTAAAREVCPNLPPTSP